jgi:thiol-disulfide isomerase/thioredoxin
MKKITILMSAVIMAAVLFTGCKKGTDDEPKGNGTVVAEGPAQVQNAVVIYFGGAWCPPCGAYGKPAKEAIKEALGDRVTLISCQLAAGRVDPMDNPSSIQLASNVFGVQSFPSLFIGGANDIISSIPSNTAMSTSSVAAANTAKNKTAIAAVDATMSISGNSLTINTRTKFFVDQTEEYYLAAHVIESGLNHTQSSDLSKNKDIHDNVLRVTASTAGTGDLISGNNKKDEVKTKSFTVALNDAWKKENMKVALVLWRKNSDGKYTICNCFIKSIQ